MVTTEKLIDWDSRICDIAKDIRVLSTVSWPMEIKEKFFALRQKGKTSLPVVSYQTPDLNHHIEALTTLMKEIDTGHSLGLYLSRTAESYLHAAKMLSHIGEAEFLTYSKLIYGSAGDYVATVSNLRLADDLLRVASDLMEAGHIDTDESECLLPESVANELKLKADAFFGHNQFQVVIDPTMASKAAAGSERVRLRAQTSFSQADIRQLLEHEIYIHSGTMLNGRNQPVLKTMGLGSPRTTATQEGLATFAEFVTNAMTIERLQRIALRIKATHLAQEGADFIEVFNFVLGLTQNETESYQTAARIFRGGDPRGSIVFTKDTSYLKGLIAVHTFMRKVIMIKKTHLIESMFAGRLALTDVVDLEEFFENKTIVPGQLIPHWVTHFNHLAAFLAYSAFTNYLRLGDIDLSDL